VDYERTPWAKLRSEQRKRDAALRYELEMESRKVGWGDPALIYDEEKDLFDSGGAARAAPPLFKFSPILTARHRPQSHLS